MTASIRRLPADYARPAAAAAAAVRGGPAAGRAANRPTSPAFTTCSPSACGPIRATFSTSTPCLPTCGGETRQRSRVVVAEVAASARRSRSRVLSTPVLEYAVLRARPDLSAATIQRPMRTLFGNLPQAAAACDFDEAELRYLSAGAAKSRPKIRKRCAAGPRADPARPLRRGGRVRGSRLLHSSPDDAEALQALDVTSTDQSRSQFGEAERDRSSKPKPPAAPTPANRCTARAASARPQRAPPGHRPPPRRQRPASQAQSLVARLEAEHNRLEIDILHLRCERCRTIGALRLELARRLKRAGNFSGAIQRLEEARSFAAGEPAVLIELGECWQHLRQFAKALDFYRPGHRAAEQQRQRSADIGGA